MSYLFKPSVRSRLLLTFFLGALLWGCSGSAERLAPQFPTYRQSMGVMLVMTPEIRIFEQLPDGGRLFQDGQSREAQSRAQTSIIRQLQSRHFSAQPVDADTMMQEDYREISALFRSVNRSIQLHTYGPQRFPTKLASFDYQVGSIADILSANGADALVMAVGFQTGAEAPVHSWFSIAVVEPHGRIVWYNVKGDSQRFDLQHADGVSDLVAATMANFWERGS